MFTDLDKKLSLLFCLSKLIVLGCISERFAPESRRPIKLCLPNVNLIKGSGESSEKHDIRDLGILTP